jgi:hypothetical protein
MNEVEFMKSFTQFPPDSYVKENDLVLQTIYFDLGSAGFDCTLAAQPLIIHDFGLLVFNFGITLGHYAKLGFQRWPYGNTKQETNQNIDECIKAIEKFGLGWFKKVDSMEKIVKYPEDGTILCLPYWRNKYRGYCALYLGQINKGIKWLEEAIAYDKTLKFDYCQRSILEMTELIEIARNKPNQLKDYFNAIAEENRQKIYSSQLRVPAKK